VIKAYAWCATAIRHDSETPRTSPTDPYGIEWGAPAKLVRLLDQVFTDEERDSALAGINELSIYREVHPPVSRRLHWITVGSVTMLLTILVALSYKMI